MKQWPITQDSFDRFLSCLHPDRHQAGQEYEGLRSRIVRFFEWRACADPETLADQAFDRVIRKVSQGENITDVPRYMFGVAKLVSLEDGRRQRREQPIVVDFPVGDKSDEHLDDGLECFEQCLAKVSAASRDLILRYYSFDKKAKIDVRKTLADSLELSANALRIKASRIRSKLEECVAKCLVGEE